MKYSIPEYGIEIEVREGCGALVASNLAKEFKSNDDDELGKAVADAVEALVLGHACAGINILDPKYLEGLRSAVEAIGNNL